MAKRLGILFALLLASSSAHAQSWGNGYYGGGWGSGIGRGYTTYPGRGYYSSGYYHESYRGRGYAAPQHYTPRGGYRWYGGPPNAYLGGRGGGWGGEW